MKLSISMILLFHFLWHQEIYLWPTCISIILLQYIVSGVTKLQLSVELLNSRIKNWQSLEKYKNSGICFTKRHSLFNYTYGVTELTTLVHVSFIQEWKSHFNLVPFYVPQFLIIIRNFYQWDFWHEKATEETNYMYTLEKNNL